MSCARDFCSIHYLQESFTAGEDIDSRGGYAAFILQCQPELRVLQAVGNDPKGGLVLYEIR